MGGVPYATHGRWSEQSTRVWCVDGTTADGTCWNQKHDTAHRDSSTCIFWAHLANGLLLAGERERDDDFWMENEGDFRREEKSPHPPPRRICLEYIAVEETTLGL